MHAHIITNDFFKNPPKHLLPEGRETWFDHHFQSTLGDNLIELCGRLCYDSQTQQKTRSSADYHKHITEVNHTSTHEAAVVALDLPTDIPCELFRILTNRPGVFYAENNGRHTHGHTIVANLRAIREWNQWGLKAISDKEYILHCQIYDELITLTKPLFPLAMHDIPMPKHGGQWGGKPYNHIHVSPTNPNPLFWSIGTSTPPNHPMLMVSFYLGGISRNLTHELVRHKYQTAVSQRSTRYVDESESEFINHPLQVQYGHSPNNAPDILRVASQDAYRNEYDHLYAAQVADGVDPFTAKKAARGAARGFLFSNLATELIFSATVSQWQRIINQRNNPAADAEIRELAAAVEIQLKSHSLI